MVSRLVAYSVANFAYSVNVNSLIVIISKKL